MRPFWPPTAGTQRVMRHCMPKPYSSSDKQGQPRDNGRTTPPTAVDEAMAGVGCPTCRVHGQQRCLLAHTWHIGLQAVFVRTSPPTRNQRDFGSSSRPAPRSRPTDQKVGGSNPPARTQNPQSAPGTPGAFLLWALSAQRPARSRRSARDSNLGTAKGSSPSRDFQRAVSSVGSSPPR